jgi:hypothetical protein
MKTPTRIRRFATLALMLAVAGCSTEHTSAPSMAPSINASAVGRSSSLLGGLLGTVGTITSTLGLTPVNGLQRTRPLPAAITVVQTIGAEGGSLSIPEAGVTVTVPAGALASPTAITMTARAGSLVAYDFEPHGIVFARPLGFSQSLRGTNATILQVPLLRLAYYADGSLLGQTGGLVSELLAGTVNLLTWTFTSDIKHFSGYLVACGRGGED